jgi:glutathione S-transferase
MLSLVLPTLVLIFAPLVASFSSDFIGIAQQQQLHRAVPVAATSRGHRRRHDTATTTPTTTLSMALTLYGSPGSRSPLVNWAAHELNLPLVAGDLSKNPHPFGQIPCLTDDEGGGGVVVVVFESGAILNYLLSKAGNEKVLHGNARTAAVISWIAWANASLDPICFLERDGRV